MTGTAKGCKLHGNKRQKVFTFICQCVLWVTSVTNRGLQREVRKAVTETVMMTSLLWSLKSRVIIDHVLSVKTCFNIVWFNYTYMVLLIMSLFYSCCCCSCVCFLPLLDKQVNIVSPNYNMLKI